MQTFLPSPDFGRSAKVLDWRRLGKQRVEADQVLRALRDPNYGWQHHPAVRQWRGYEGALVLYRNAMILEWVSRGYNNTMPLLEAPESPEMPWWLGSREIHRSHRSNLLRKDRDWYGRFRWRVPDNLPYLWPFQDDSGECWVEFDEAVA